MRLLIFSSHNPPKCSFNLKNRNSYLTNAHAAPDLKFIILQTFYQVEVGFNYFTYYTKLLQNLSCCYDFYQMNQ